MSLAILFDYIAKQEDALKQALSSKINNSDDNITAIGHEIGVRIERI